KKRVILFIVALQGFLGPLSSSIYIPAIAQVRQSFNTTSTMINLTISLYMFTMGIAPLIWATLSERNGRRAIYVVSTLVYVVSTVSCGLSRSTTPFIIARIFQSVGASASQAVGAGTITDIFYVHERGNSMGLFLLGPLIGPVVGPIVGGYINEFLEWRYIFWVLAVVGSCIFFLILFFVPETSSVMLKRRQLKNNSQEATQKESMLKSMVRPIQYLTKPAVVFAAIPYSVGYGFMYFMISSLPSQLILHYQFSSSQIGLMYIANGAGNALGALISGKLSDVTLNREKDPERRTPEMRLPSMWLGIVLFPLGQLIYGWSFEMEVHIAVGIVGLLFLGLGVGILQTPSNTYIVDAYQTHSASAMSAANLMRCIFAGSTPLLAPTLLSKVGNGWSMTILAAISLLTGISVFLVQRYGKYWRSKDLGLDTN
ncbi:MFS general substrate transporter, partial [Backusella circina FSU 941]